MMAPLNQIVQILAWLIALIEAIVGLYVLLLNYRHTTNRYVSAFLFILAVNTLAVGSLVSASSPGQARLPSIMIAASIPAIMPALLLALVALIKPDWLQGARTWWRWIALILVVAPFVLTFSDVFLNTRLWYTGLDVGAYTGGYTPVSEFTAGALKTILPISNFILSSVAVLVFTLYILFVERGIPSKVRAIAGLILIPTLLSAVQSIFGLEAGLASLIVVIISGWFAASFAYTLLYQMVATQQFQAGSLHTRLATLVIIVSAPLLVALALFLSNRAQTQIQADAEKILVAANQSVSETITLWLQYNEKALSNLVSTADITSMDPARQKPLLESMAATYPQMYLVSTTDTSGINVARNDEEAPKDYSDRDWVKQVLEGAPLAYQTLVGRTSGQPALVVSMPIKDAHGDIIGVGMFATDLDQISSQVTRTEIGPGGLTYVVDQNNLLVAHPDPAQTAELKDMGAEPPVVAMRQGTQGSFSFLDAEGQNWSAEISQLPNGWGVITQQSEAELLAPIRRFQRTTLFVAGLGILLLLGMTWITVRQSLQPIRSLTDTALAITQGDLSRQAPVESQDELGTLAESFNAMTGQLSELISSLEERVTERTQDLEQRAVQLRATADVAREAAAIRDPERLLNNVVRLISDRFNFYHAGIFLLSEGASNNGSAGSGFAVLRAASSEGGQRMLARQHRLKIGQVGIVGHVAATGQPRIALDVGTDAVFFNNPDLPMTRSEMALPLKVQNRVIGVLDVQSTQPAAFTEEDLAILQILADQVALAIENARLLEESQQALEELESRYELQIRQGWQKWLAGRSLAYAFDPTGVKRLSPDFQPEQTGLRASTASTSPDEESGRVLEIPIELRSQRLGYLRLRREEEAGAWTPEDKELVRETVSQAALSLENARLLEEIQERATQEELINQIIARAQGSLNIEAVMRNVVQEIGRMMNLSKTQIRLNEPAPGSHLAASEPGGVFGQTPQRKEP
jgi:GAF domain-containing protein/HAMP domain-containing protein